MKKQIALVLPGIIISCLFLIPAGSGIESPTGTETVLFTLAGGSYHMMFNGDRLFWLQDSKYLNASERGFYVYNLTRIANNHRNFLFNNSDQRKNQGTGEATVESGYLVSTCFFF